MKRKHEFPPETKWLAFGASYGASLATWTRQRHPYLVHAAVASSGPLLAKEDFPDYFRIVETSLGTRNCKSVISDAFEQIANELLTLDGQQLLNEHLMYD